MKRLSLFAIALFAGSALVAQDLPKPSPMGVVKQEVGLTKIRVEYSRPGVKDRKIFGDLVPFDKMWRTGANKASAISFSTDVKVNGKDLIAGDYAIFTIPGADSWEFLFNTNLDQWGTGNYQDTEESLRIRVRTQKVPHTETFTFTVDNLTDTSCDVCMVWEETRACFKVEVDVDAKAEENILAKINEIENAYGVYNTSARWYLDNNKDAKQALEWATKSTQIRETFWNLITLSRAQAANNDFKGAIATAEKSKAMAIEAGYDNYAKMNDENIAQWRGKAGRK